MNRLQSVIAIFLCFIISGCAKPKVIVKHHTKVIKKVIKPKQKYKQNVKVPMVARIYFDSDDYRIREEELNKILLITNWAIQEMHNTGKPLKLIIRGYSSWPDEEKNMRLSQYRAASVAKIILSKTQAIVLQLEYDTFLESMTKQNRNPNLQEKMRLVEIYPYFERPVSFAMPKAPGIGKVSRKTLKKACGCQINNAQEAYKAKEAIYSEIFYEDA